MKRFTSCIMQQTVRFGSCLIRGDRNGISRLEGILALNNGKEWLVRSLTPPERQFITLLGYTFMQATCLDNCRIPWGFSVSWYFSNIQSVLCCNNKFLYFFTGELNHFDVSVNTLYGTIPPSIGNLSQMLELYLDDNNFSGSLPSSLGRLRKYYIASFRK